MRPTPRQWAHYRELIRRPDVRATPANASIISRIDLMRDTITGSELANAIMEITLRSDNLWFAHDELEQSCIDWVLF